MNSSCVTIVSSTYVKPVVAISFYVLLLSHATLGLEVAVVHVRVKHDDRETEHKGHVGVREEGPL